MDEKKTVNLSKRMILFLLSQGITLFGSSVVQFAIIWFITLEKKSGLWVSILTFASFVPQFLISFVSGVWADRYSRKALIIISDSVIAISTLLLVIMYPLINDKEYFFPLLVLISVIRSLGTGVQTPAVNAAITSLVPEEKLMKFNGTNSFIQSLVQFVAPVVAGLLLSFISFSVTLLVDIISAVIGVFILMFISIPYTRNDNTYSVGKEMKEGFKYAAREKNIGLLLLIFGIFIFFCVPAGFLSSLFVTRYYVEEVTNTSYLYMSTVEIVGFIGMTLGGLLISVWGGFKNRMKTFVFGMISFGILAIFMGAVINFIVYLVLMVIYGIALTMIQTSSMTILQEKTASEMQGRVFGLFGAMYSGFLPLGMICFGPLADVFSLRILMIVSGVFLILMAIVIISMRKFYKFGMANQNVMKEENNENINRDN